ncbi:DUF885 domain-containing protein [Lipingzhangella sp. LS1_29]|uniref:DUF885 domain-containing protein n=1 Tax=Lipingzhangella rawalii TaxID=2055835 RepID=A0ABU2H2P6_9ACTN|nr:DUF885 domain-containing protein [Lipingzhangella rawalii]MDS1269139.1 DUF885 domain-containing protein [Lipingzhangella rawalii]
MTPIFELCERYVDQWSTLDPVAASSTGITGTLGTATDYSPEGIDARADLIRQTLAELDTRQAHTHADRRAAAHLRERLEAERAWYEAGEAHRWLSAPIGLLMHIRVSIELMPRETEQDWQRIRDRLAAVPTMLHGWRTSLTHGHAHGLTAAHRQALAVAEQADGYAHGTHQHLVDAHSGPLATELQRAADAAHTAYAEFAQFLRQDYAPHASTTDAVGEDRYRIASRLYLGSDIDPHEAYAWGWDELARIETELATEADRIHPGATIEQATEHLNRTAHVASEQAYHEWLRYWHDWALDTLDGTLVDIDPRLRALDVTLVTDPTAGSPYYTPPTEDFSRPGRTWWPIANRSRFTTWNELSTVFHEGVPGHHLQLGANRVHSHTLSRFSTITDVSGHAEGWALYAERLADELGWFTEPGTRLGMLTSSALRAARVVIDIGVHLDLTRPDGTRWTFDNAQEFLRDRGRLAPHQVQPEILRYFGWPGQAISYKLGERAWMNARARAETRPGFDLKDWHTTALSLGPLGLDTLATELDHIDTTSG